MDSDPSKPEADGRLPRDPPAALLRAYLETHDAPCPICGYNLRGVTLSLCPECQSEIQLGVSPSNASLSAWLLALLSFAMPLSFDLLIGGLMVVGVIMSGGENREGVFLMVSLLTLTMACIGMLWVLVARKRQWLGMTPRRQWRIAWTIFVGVFVVHLMVGVGTMLMAR